MQKRQQMKKIENEILKLKSSPLYDYRVNNNYLPVIGEGSLDASIAFIGEAPGESEALCGLPFCGRSGKFLDELFISIGLVREKVYITSIVKDRPPKNRDPSTREINIYTPFLDRQLQIIKPKVIVMLGSHSMKYIFTKSGLDRELKPIGKIHGKVYESEFLWGKVKLIPLYHPAAALHNGSLRKVLIDDFKKIKKYI